MKPALKVLLGFTFVLVPFWAQYAGFHFPAPAFVLSYLAGLSLWAIGYYQLIKGGTSADLNPLFTIGLVLFATMPPEISRDIYVYLLEGKLAIQGTTTYTDAAANLLHPFYVYMDPHWLDCPNQYGPVPLFVFQVVAWLGGDSAFMDILFMKIFDIVWSVCIFFLVKYIAKSLQLNEVRAQIIFCLNPIFFIQGLGQMHIDLLSCVFVCAFIYGIAQNRMWIVGISIGLMGATKSMLFPLFWGLVLIYAIYAYKQKILKMQHLALSVLYSIVVFCVAYWPIWQGLDTILIPMAYHENKEPVKSIVELISYLLAYFLPQSGAKYGTVDPFLQDKIYWGHQLKPVFQVLALLIAARLSFFLIYAKNLHQLFYGFCRIMLLVFILYSPVMHAWYFLFVLPFLAITDRQKEVIWYAVVVLSLANTYEIGLTVGGAIGNFVMIFFTILSVLSYFMYFGKFYFSFGVSSDLREAEAVDLVIRDK